MPLATFEILCAVVVALTLGAMLLTTPTVVRGLSPARTNLLGDYVLLVIAGLVGEQSSITFYRHYEYAPDWHLRVGDVPLLVPLIWPLVILSARGVRESLSPDARPWQRSLIIFGLVSADASLMEVLATRAGLWSWSEGGHLDVPVLGILAWGFFAAGADALLDRLEGLSRLLVIPCSVLVAHALICASWWYGLRWVLRDDLGIASVLAVLGLGAIASLEALRLRRSRRLLPPAVFLPRLAATALFAVLFVTSAFDAWPYWAHLVAIAVPYWLVTDVTAIGRLVPRPRRAPS